MKFKELFKEIEDHDKNDPKDVYALLSHLMEEVGELSVALAVEKGDKKRELEEPAVNEAVDVCIMALAIFFAKGGTQETLKKILEEKIP